MTYPLSIGDLDLLLRPLPPDLLLERDLDFELCSSPEVWLLLLGRSLLSSGLTDGDFDFRRGEGLFLTGELELDFLLLPGDLLGDGRFLIWDTEFDLLRRTGDLWGERFLLNGERDLDFLNGDLSGGGLLLTGDSDLDLSLLGRSFLSLLGSGFGLSDELDRSLGFFMTFSLPRFNGGETDSLTFLLLLGSESPEDDLCLADCFFNRRGSSFNFIAASAFCRKTDSVSDSDSSADDLSAFGGIFSVSDSDSDESLSCFLFFLPFCFLSMISPSEEPSLGVSCSRLILCLFLSPRLVSGSGSSSGDCLPFLSATSMSDISPSSRFLLCFLFL